MSPPVPPRDGPACGCGDAFAGPGACGCPRRRARRVRRGWVRRAMIALLAERPMHGYEMISELAARTTGPWRPSPGSIYPTLQALEDEGLVTATENGGRRSYRLTQAGQQLAATPGLPSPWDEFEPPTDPEVTLLQQASTQLVAAVDQVLLASTPEQKARVVDLLAQARRAVFAVLAEAADEAADEADDVPAAREPISLHIPEQPR